MKAKAGSIITLTFVFALYTCIDPYYPKLKSQKPYLVVDGQITDENSSYTVKLSRTMQDEITAPDPVDNSEVYITDNLNSVILLRNKGDGIYKTDSLEFRGYAGRTYTLHILTDKGEEYVSTDCLMHSVPDIDSIYYARHEQFANNATESQIGLMIYLDSKNGDDDQFYRWSFTETWEFRLPTIKKYEYVDSKNIFPVKNVKLFCWKTKSSDQVLIHQPAIGGSQICHQPLFFVASDKSDRLIIEYSILVKQYSISKTEYDFWSDLKKTDESGGDIFAAQPFAVPGNIHNIKDPEERVLGFFQVSSVKQKRIFIYNAIHDFNLPFYHYECNRIEEGPEKRGMSFDDIYIMYCVNSHYVFIEPEYTDTGQLDKLVFATPECANCELTGTTTKPVFWKDYF